VVRARSRPQGACNLRRLTMPKACCSPRSTTPIPC
jgi:hypothetical protein